MEIPYFRPASRAVSIRDQKEIRSAANREYDHLKENLVELYQKLTVVKDRLREA